MELLKKYYNKEKMRILLVTVITSMIVHFALYATSVTGPDTLLNSMYHQADIWETMLLRFGLFFVQIIKGNVVSPILATLISSILLGITVNVVLDIFDIKNKYFKYITAIVFAVAPNISSTLTFFYCSDAYLLGLLFATLAVYIIRKYENKKLVSNYKWFTVSFSYGNVSNIFISNYGFMCCYIINRCIKQ